MINSELNKRFGSFDFIWRSGGMVGRAARRCAAGAEAAGAAAAEPLPEARGASRHGAARHGASISVLGFRIHTCQG